MQTVWTLPYWEIAFRLFVAGILGGLIGWEREKNNHPAGFRTHILVSLGSALIMLISIYGFSDFMGQKNVQFDPSRISAQVVSGIGFLGAGTILRHGVSVTGLTTAASLWVVAGIGLAVGTGFMFGAALTTVLVLVSLELLNRLEKILIKKRRLRIIQLIVADDPGKLGELASLIARNGGSIRKVNMDEGEEDDHYLGITFHVRLPEKITLAELCEEIRKVKGVKTVRTE
ncbi:MgtC/SapB family protein [Paenactinomyces guangxiensis]|uniref:MgtC/SapB family protein n=1 Tax=Paenactinomyces guangxiensis TaxID=1490290 RepID=A0A7W1WTU3_9BACL|nr:MgtC/SapB family protein [Paenactinomyces guangxiensis]MBA4495852.1 MgtC/SapB family protein [Paenactinomyces guangxiensis]MBH8593011.1 MgtC/SapB family protein [Paenactinomyces guangxiensis]